MKIYLRLTFLFSLLLLYSCSPSEKNPIKNKISKTNQSDASYEILLKSGTIKSKNSKKNIKKTLLSDSYAFVQFNKILTSKEKKYFSEQTGVKLIEYIPNKTYISFIPKNLSMEFLNTHGVRNIISISPEYKISPSLKKTLELPFYTNNRKNIKLLISYYNPNDKKNLIDTLTKNDQLKIIKKNDLSNSLIIKSPASLKNINSIASHPYVKYLENAEKSYSVQNQEGRTNHRANTLFTNSNNIIKNYDGTGVEIGLGDSGVIGPHLDLNDRIISQKECQDSQGDYVDEGDHGDHVAGIILGKGLIDPTKKGMAPGAKIRTFIYSDVIKKIDQGSEEIKNITLTSNSYGAICSDPTIQEKLPLLNVQYDSDTRLVDKQSDQEISLLHVFAAGNYAQYGTKDTCLNYPRCGALNLGKYYTISGDSQVAKNILTVGNVFKHDTRAITSSCGPTIDGRIKPEICATGQKIISTVPNDRYTEYSGTSMATPGGNRSVSPIISSL